LRFLAFLIRKNIHTQFINEIYYGIRIKHFFQGRGVRNCKGV
jgi:hypothetical protein